ncbi:MAG: serine/threonine protein kinase with repeat, partial [Bacteroidetes bacterium]|nr:serine/threonine protein kinase with repeat [Bacteroidota bacterium]
MIGLTISHYKVLEKLGEGGMGVVYKAQDTKLLRPVALKFLTPEMTRDQDAKKRFIQEARAASALDHPNIAVVHDVDETADGHLFICMAYYDGQTLKTNLTKGPFGIDEAVQLILQIASGLQRAHESNIVHRDIKPANIIITSNGEIKIVDFGLAKLSAQTRASRTLITAGTAAYMAPEQIMGSEADGRSDLFSLGVVFYETIAGRRPFAGEHEAALFYSIVNAEPAAPSTIRHEIPQELDRIILRLLEKDPAKRYQYAADLREDLKHFLGEKPTPRPLMQLRRVLRGKPYIPLVAGSTLVVALALLLATGVLQQWFERSRVTEPHYIGVLPFNLIGGDSTKMVLCDGIYDRVVSGLVRMHSALGKSHICPASEMRKYRGKNVRQAREGSSITLGVEGTIQWISDQVRATVTVIETDKLASIDSRDVSVAAASLPELELKLIDAIAEMLGGRLTSAQVFGLTAGTTKDEKAYDYFARGRGELLFYTDRTRLNNSIQLFHRAITLDSLFAVAYAGLGEAYWRKFSGTKDIQWTDSAFKACRRAQSLDTSVAEVRFTLGLLYHGVGKDSLAILEYQSILAGDSLNAAAYMELGEAYGLARQPQQAEAAYRQAIRLRPFDWQTYHYLGRAYANNKEYTKAIDTWNEAARRTPNQPLIHNGLGVALFNLDDWTGAIEHFNRALEADSGRYQVYSNLATAYYYDEMIEQAIKVYQKAIRFTPTDHQVWGGLGAAYHELGGKKLAQESYEKAVSLALGLLGLNPSDPKVLSQLAGYYANLGKKAESRAALRKATALAPSDKGVMSRAVTTFELLGDREQAIIWLRKVVAQGPIPQEIEHSPEMKNLREDPRYKQLTKGGGTGK